MVGRIEKAYLASSVVAGLFLVIAIATPGWLIMKYNLSNAVEEFGGSNRIQYPEITRYVERIQIEVDFSLLYVVSCVGPVCTSKTVDELSNIYPSMGYNSIPYYARGIDNLETYRDEGIAALILYIIGVIMLVIYTRRGNYGSRLTGGIAWGLIGVAGILSAALVGQFADINRKLSNNFRLVSLLELKLSTPYSVIWMGFASAVLFLTLVPLSWALKIHKQLPQTGHVIQLARTEDGQLPILQLQKAANKMQGYSELQEEQPPSYATVVTEGGSVRQGGVFDSGNIIDSNRR